MSKFPYFIGCKLAKTSEIMPSFSRHIYLLSSSDTLTDLWQRCLQDSKPQVSIQSLEEHTSVKSTKYRVSGINTALVLKGNPTPKL